MNNEIKEILDNIEVNELKYHKWYCSVEKDNMQKILDYITNLQQENERLKAIKPCMLNFQECYVVKDYKSRCEKAIEELKSWQLDCNYSKENEIYQYIINILQNGSEKR